MELEAKISYKLTFNATLTASRGENWKLFAADFYELELSGKFNIDKAYLGLDRILKILFNGFKFFENLDWILKSF